MSVTLKRPMRVFRCYYICENEDCSPTGSEWVDEALVVTTGFCPSCDAEVSPYLSEELFEERAEFDPEGK
jgi:hypothetical protein